jgi:hypothetical protein
MKHKVPSEIAVHPNTAKELRYDPETGLFDAEGGAPVSFDALRSRLPTGGVSQLREWLDELEE